MYIIKNKKMTIINKIVAITIGSLFIVSCGGNNSENHDKTDSLDIHIKDTTAITVEDSTKFKFDFTIANIPSPASYLHDFAVYGYNYDNSILNSPKKIGSYSNDFYKSINLGIYCIDMAYAMDNNNGQDVLLYMKNVMSISDGLGLKNSIINMVGKRAETNLSNKDSLFQILDEIFIKSDYYLRTNNRVYTATNVFVGSWLESFYLTCKIISTIKDAEIKTKVYKQLWDQRFHLGNLISLLNDFKDKKDCAELINDLKIIHEEIKAVKQPNEITDDKFKSISNKIIELRNKITK